jgi:hypothetical protein
MWVALLVLAAVVLVVLVTLARRSGGGELRSVRSHQGTMATMERLESRAVSTVAPPAPASSEHGPEPIHTADLEGRAPARPAVPPARLVFDDATPAGPRSVGPGSDTGPRRDRRHHQHALDTMNHPSRQGSTVVVVLVLVLLAGALAYLAVRHPSHKRTPAVAASTTTSTVAAGHGSGNRSTHGRHTRTPAPPPKPSKLVASTSSSGAATYTVPAGSYSLVVATTESCWVQATAQPSGSVVWQGLLPPGGSQAVPATGQLVVILGAAGASMTVDGVPVVLPVGAVTPFTATFVPQTT